MRTYGQRLCSSNVSRPSRVFRESPSLSTCRSKAYISCRLDWMADSGMSARFKPIILSRNLAGCTGRSEGWCPVVSSGTGVVQG